VPTSTAPVPPVATLIETASRLTTTSEDEAERQAWVERQREAAEAAEVLARFEERVVDEVEYHAINPHTVLSAHEWEHRQRRLLKQREELKA